jgi:prepilin peptidase CpaA
MMQQGGGSMFGGMPNGAAWGALFTALLLAGCVTDVRTRRIPNLLVLALLVGGLGFSLATRPVALALRESGAGLLLGFAIWIVFYVASVIGAGDVKFFAAAGAWLGPSATWRAALVAAVVGGVLAVGFLIRERRLSSTLRRMMLAVSSRSTALLATDADHVVSRQRQLPYGVALATGALIAAWWPGFSG